MRVKIQSDGCFYRLSSIISNAVSPKVARIPQKITRKWCFTAAAGDSTFIATYRQAFIEASVGETALKVTQATI